MIQVTPSHPEQGHDLLQLRSAMNSETLVSLLIKNTVLEARKGMASYPRSINGETKVESQARGNRQRGSRFLLSVPTVLCFSGHTKLHTAISFVPSVGE